MAGSSVRCPVAELPDPVAALPDELCPSVAAHLWLTASAVAASAQGDSRTATVSSARLATYPSDRPGTTSTWS